MFAIKWTFWIGFGAFYAALAVIFGAFGSHALKSKLSPSDFDIFQTASQYHMYHALGILAIGMVATRIDSTLLNTAGIFIAVGSIIFSGSLYALVLTDTRILGAVTPIGGVLLIIGWLSFAWCAFSL